MFEAEEAISIDKAGIAALEFAVAKCRRSILKELPSAFRFIHAEQCQHHPRVAVRIDRGILANARLQRGDATDDGIEGLLG